MEIKLTAQAEADLIEIADFIAKDNPSAAERYVRRLRDRESIDLFMEDLQEVVSTLSVEAA